MNAETIQQWAADDNEYGPGPPRRVHHRAVLFFNVANIFNFSQQRFSSKVIFAPLITVLLSFLQSSPFERRPLAFTVSVACSVAYFFTLIAAKFIFPGFASHFEVLTSVFGSLAVSTLISLTLHLPGWSILLIPLFMGGFFKPLNKFHSTYPHPRTMQTLLPLFNVTVHNICIHSLEVNIDSEDP